LTNEASKVFKKVAVFSDEKTNVNQLVNNTVEQVIKTAQQNYAAKQKAVVKPAKQKAVVKPAKQKAVVKQKLVINPELCEYEKIRLNNINARLALLKELGFSQEKVKKVKKTPKPKVIMSTVLRKSERLKKL